jgi:hypothetical protein
MTLKTEFFLTDFGADGTSTTIIDLQSNYQKSSFGGAFDPCDDYPCTITHGGIDYIVSAPNTCHTFHLELINGSWVISYPSVACPPEFNDGSSQGGGGTTGGGSDDNNTSSGGNPSGGGDNTNPDNTGDDGNDYGQPGGGGNNGGTTSGGTSGSGDNDDNDYVICPPTPEGYEGDIQCASDVTTPVVCLTACQDQIVQDECDEVTDFLEQNPNFKTVLKSLDDDSNINFEKICIKFENITSIVYGEGNANQPWVRLPSNLTNKIQAFGHYHYETTSTANGDTESIFSMQDLVEIAKLESLDLLDEKFVAFLSTGKGTYYAFTINDKQKLLNSLHYLINNKLPETSNPDIFNAWNESRINWEIYKKKYFKGRNAPIKRFNFDNIEVLSAFLELLNEADMGLNFYKADQDFNNFIKVTYDINSPNNIKEQNCN